MNKTSFTHASVSAEYNFVHSFIVTKCYIWSDYLKENIFYLLYIPQIVIVPVDS